MRMQTFDETGSPRAMGEARHRLPPPLVRVPRTAVPGPQPPRARVEERVQALRQARAQGQSELQGILQNLDGRRVIRDEGGTVCWHALRALVPLRIGDQDLMQMVASMGATVAADGVVYGLCVDQEDASLENAARNLLQDFDDSA